ncbi:MAG TPA: DUF72 domain-containing protein [Clostridiaceae bacterium]|nr:DUF72 domain-containing protein [Clostridiaceae bacterium]
MIYIGTSGYSYNDWVGTFYREGITKSEMLEEYSKVFKFTEINSTYYSIPNKYMFLSLIKKTPDDFVFTVKLHKSMTHAKDADEKAYKDFNDAITPLKESGKLGCIVAQFPYSFKYTDQNLDYIKGIRDKFKDVDINVEFRNNSWMNTSVYEKLLKYSIGFINVDEPDIKGLVKKTGIVTSKIGYIRFHGRNAEKWYSHNESYERYNYLYKEDELKEWLPSIKFIKKNAHITFIAFNNHFKAKGADNAKMLQELLDK